MASYSSKDPIHRRYLTNAGWMDRWMNGLAGRKGGTVDGWMGERKRRKEEGSDKKGMEGGREGKRQKERGERGTERTSGEGRTQRHGFRKCRQAGKVL